MKKTIFLAVLPLISLFSFTATNNKVNAGERDIVYQADFEGITVNKDHTADNATGFIWASDWERTKTGTHNGSNMLNVAINDKDQYGYSTIGGFGIGMNSNLALCTLGEPYRTTTYFEMSNVEFIFVEFVGGPGKWGSVKLYPNGQVLANPGGNNIWGVTYENNILSFAFTMAFNTDENVNGYIKFTAFNAVNANLYLDDITIERENHIYAENFEKESLGVFDSTDSNKFCKVYTENSTVEIATHNGSKKLKGSYTPNANEGVTAFFINRLAMLNMGRDHIVSIDIATENVDTLFIYYGGTWIANPSYLQINMKNNQITNNGTAFSEPTFINGTLNFKFNSNLTDGNYCQFQFIGESKTNTSVPGIVYVDNIEMKQIPVVNKIRIDTTDAKLVFEYGEAYSNTGLKVYGHLTDGSERLLSANEYQTNGYDPRAVGNQRIAISVGNVTEYYIITVIRTALGLEVNLEDIKTNYAYGEALDLSNLIVKAVYNDNVKEEITHGVVEGGYWIEYGDFDSYKEGKYTITIRYQKVYTTIEVTVGAIDKVDFSGTTFEKM